MSTPHYLNYDHDKSQCGTQNSHIYLPCTCVYSGLCVSMLVKMTWMIDNVFKALHIVKISGPRTDIYNTGSVIIYHDYATIVKEDDEAPL